MPRSGTTLIETIIASHPNVHGGGELRHLHRLLPSENGPEDKLYPQIMKNADILAIQRIAEDYDELVAAMAGEHPRITDKMPANFVFLGAIHALMPNAKIIHMVRDPVDTCLSCFTRLFDKAQYHSYDQIELGTYYNNYRRLMSHWRDVLPKDAFMDVRYENIVEDFEPNVRALIEWCNLDWNEACMSPHKTKRSVRTASVTQVREPIYKTSVKKWKAYQKQLQPLLNTLGDNAEI
nr:sulfotransferase [Pseudorhodobacter ferrugineus]